MTLQPPIPAELWDQIPPASQAAILAFVQQYESRLQALQDQVTELQQRLNQNSANSFKPPSSDPLTLKRSPPKPLAMSGQMFLVPKLRLGTVFAKLCFAGGSPPCKRETEFRGRRSQTEFGNEERGNEEGPISMEL